MDGSATQGRKRRGVASVVGMNVGQKDLPQFGGRHAGIREPGGEFVEDAGHAEARVHEDPAVLGTDQIDVQKCWAGRHWQGDPP